MNNYYIEFFELATELKQLNRESLNKKLLKLNNPTYYNKFIYKNPIEKYGYKGKTINPILIAINNMLKILKTDDSNTLSNLQKEFSWAYNNYPSYKCIDL